LNLPLIVSVIVIVALALLGLIGYLIDRSADRHEGD
jgi:preprotein translocase subunit Sss1